MDTYISDLAPYPPTRVNEPYQEKLIAVGWLNLNHPYAKGTVSQDFVRCLELFCSNALLRIFGARPCTLCGNNEIVRVRLSSGKDVRLYGTYELRVPSISGDRIYAFPDIILHYVLAHNYKPPQEFIDSVLCAPLPGTPEYEDFVAPWKRLFP